MLLDKVKRNIKLSYNLFIAIIEAVNKQINEEKEIAQYSARVKDLNIEHFDIHVEILKELKIIDINEDKYVITQLGNDIKMQNNTIANIILEYMYKSEELFEFLNFENKQILNNDIYFLNSDISMRYVCFRNLFFEIGIFLNVKENWNLIQINQLYNKYFDQEKTMSLNTLKTILEKQEKQGKIAEEFVLKYERNRLNDFSEKIKIISEINTIAGYDIISHDKNGEEIYIEVKSYFSNPRIYFTKNEFETSKKLRNKYYIYIVDISRINDESYIPTIINNPYENMMESDKYKKTIELYSIELEDNF